MQAPPNRTDQEAHDLLAAELERLEPRRAALGEAGSLQVAAWTLLHGYEFEAAELGFRRVVELRPDAVEALYNRGVCLLELDRFDAAAECFRAATELHDRLAADAESEGLDWIEEDPAYRLGNALHAKGDLAGAVEAYEESARRNTIGTEALWELARCRMALEQPVEALDAVERLLARPTVRLAVRAQAEALRADAARLLGRP